MIPAYFQDRPFLPLVTERLILRPYQKGDAEELARLANDIRVAERLARLPHPYSLEDAHWWINTSHERLKTRTEVSLGIFRRTDNVLLGGIGLGEEFGYWLGYEHWGQGYMKEAVKGFLHFACVTLKVPEIVGCARTDNTASRRIFEGFGFRETGTKQLSSLAYEGTQPGITYALTSQDFLAHYNSVKRPIVSVVAAALVNEKGELLLADRPPGKKLAGVWELPGGKLEPDETPEYALIRELKEELHIDVSEEDLEPLTFASYGYETFHLIMPIYLVRKWKGDPHGAEGQNLVWVKYEDLANYSLPPADIMLTHRLADVLMGQGVW
jgi:8-oxo-dGTP diphosphatase